MRVRGHDGVGSQYAVGQEQGRRSGRRLYFKYGLRLLPNLCEGFHPMIHDDAVARETDVGINRRSAGIGVWQV